MNPSKIRLAIIEDELMVSGMLEAWIARYRDLDLVGCAADGEAGWELCQSSEPDIALIDIQLPKLDGLALIERLTARFPNMRFLVMSGLMDAYTVWRVLQSGVHGYICKSHPPQQLVDAIRDVARGYTFFGPVFSQVKRDWLSQPEAFQKILSAREQQILRGVAAALCHRSPKSMPPATILGDSTAKAHGGKRNKINRGFTRIRTNPNPPRPCCRASSSNSDYEDEDATETIYGKSHQLWHAKGG